MFISYICFMYLIAQSPSICIKQRCIKLIENTEILCFTLTESSSKKDDFFVCGNKWWTTKTNTVKSLKAGDS